MHAMQILTPAQAVTAFFELLGDEAFDADEVAEAVREIGNPGARLPVAKTRETVNDYLRNGWERFPPGDYGGVICLRSGPAGRGTRTYVYIADCGDYRLDYVER